MTPEHELRPVGAFLLVLIQFAAFMTVWVVAAMLVEVGLQAPEGEPVGVLVGTWNLVAAMVIGPLTALYVGLNRYAAETPTARALRLTRPTGRQAACAALAAAGGALLAPLTSSRAAGAHPVSEILLLCAYPVAAELLYRGFLQPRMARSIGAWRAVGVTFTLFVVGQINPYLMPAAALIGALTGLAAWRSGSTWVPLAAHVGHQASRLFLHERLPPPAALGALAAVALVWRLGRPEA